MINFLKDEQPTWNKDLGEADDFGAFSGRLLYYLDGLVDPTLEVEPYPKVTITLLRPRHRQTYGSACTAATLKTVGSELEGLSVIGMREDLG